jgi:hypothetical protein
MNIDLPFLAGSVATGIFTLSTLPMLVKASRTKDLASYSLGNIGLANMGNVLSSLYVFHLPMGPVWALHSFHLVTSGLMLVWYLRYALPRNRPRTGWPTAAATTPPLMAIRVRRALDAVVA